MLYRITLFTMLLLLCAQVQALPFNDDMVDNSIRTGSFARSRVAGTVPTGTADLARYTSKESVPENLTNPVGMSKSSYLRGERLFSVNCTACHGNIDKDLYTPGVAGTYLGAPNISDAFYATRTDASLYSTIRFGNVIMPGLGWKLSDQELWDVVNFLRRVQSKKQSSQENAEKKAE